MPTAPPEKVTAVHAMGLLYVGAGLGLSCDLGSQIRVEAELGGYLAFPSSGWFVRPGIGLSYDF